MNQKKLGYQSILLVICVILVILLLIKYVLSKEKLTEGFNTDTNADFNKIIGDENMSQRNAGARKEALFEAAETSIDKSIAEQGYLRFENADTNSELMDLYVSQILNSDQNNPNAILESGNLTDLPSVIEDNKEKYNHELRKINITKQIKQDYLIKVLRHKIDLLLNSLKSVPEIKNDFESLKDPENAHLVKILKRPESYD